MRMRSVYVGLLAMAVAGCGGGGSDDDVDVDAGPPPDAGTPLCEAEAPDVIEPIWMAGGTGTRAELGKFGKADAIFVDPSGLLLAGDEDPDFEELHIFDLASDDPEQLGDWLAPVADLGADPGPGGDGPLEFRAISGFARDPMTGEIFVVEQGNFRVQVLAPAADPRVAPHFTHVRFFGGPAADLDAPDDGEFVRLQAARFDSERRLYLSDDAKNNAKSARRDIQVFDPGGAFLAKFGDGPSGSLGEDGNLSEPENFVIDEARNRIYVCDEGPGDVAVYRYDDRAFVTRFGGGGGTPNGIDLDQYGFLYIVYEGEDADTAVRVFDPVSLQEIYRFGGGSASTDQTPGLFSSPDTLIIDRERDLLIVADQGHDRIQGFALSEIQRRACLRGMEVIAPRRALAGSSITVWVRMLDRFGRVDRAIFDGQVALRVTQGGTPVAGAPSSVALTHGAGALTFPAPAAGTVALEVRAGAFVESIAVEVTDGADARAVTGPLSGADLTWSGVVRVSGEASVAQGDTLTVEAGTLVVMDAQARVLVQGGLTIAGTAEQPVYVVAANPAAPWSQIEHAGAAATLSYAVLAHGADAELIRHCCGPALYTRAGTLALDHVAFVDSPGKALYAVDTDVTMADVHVERLQMGPEFLNCTVDLEDLHVIEMRGVQDNDGLYFANIDGDGSYRARRVVLAGGDDDALDTRSADPDITDLVIRNWVDKGISYNGSNGHIRDCLIVGADYGVVIKDDMGGTTTTRFTRCTIARHATAAFRVANHADGAKLTPVLDHVILWDAPASLSTDYQFDDMTLNSCDIEHPQATSGADNISADPRFLDPARGDFRVNPASPAYAAEIGWRGWP